MISKFLVKNYDNIIFIIIISFLVFINTIYFYLNLFSLIDVKQYAYDELFINYQSGFIRRGLLGEIFWQINNLTSIKPKIFFSILFFILYLVKIYFFFKIFKKFIIFKVIFISIIFSPALLLFHIYDPNMYFIKDIFIKVTIVLHGYFFIKTSEYKDQSERYLYYLKFIIIPILFIVILTHEYQIFFIGVHFLISIGKVKNNTEFKNLIKIYSILLLPFLLVISFFGDLSQFQNLSEILKKFDVSLNPHLGGGIIKYIGAFYKWHFFYFSYRDFINLLLSIVLSILIFYIFFNFLKIENILLDCSKYQKNYLLYYLPCLIPVLLTTDHGRNISFISTHLIIYYLTLNLNINKFNNLRIILSKKIFISFILILFVFFYIFMWKLDQFAGFGLRGIPNDIFKSSLFAEVIKFIKFLYNLIDNYIITLPQIKL